MRNNINNNNDDNNIEKYFMKCFIRIKKSLIYNKNVTYDNIRRFFFVPTRFSHDYTGELFDCPELALTVYNRQRDSKEVNRSSAVERFANQRFN